MWRFWTRGWGPRAWWHWFRSEGWPVWVAWRLPRRIALWAFIRVYAFDGRSPGPEYERVYRAWEAGEEAQRLERQQAAQAYAELEAAGAPMVTQGAPFVPIGQEDIARVLEQELATYLDAQVITGETIGPLRRSLFVPWDSDWNGLVREETAKRERRL